LRGWIEHPSEPKELLLAWQAPPTVADRLRWAVGRLKLAEEEISFDYLEGQEFTDLNLGRTFQQIKDAGYSYYPAFDRRKRPEGGFRDRVLEAFLRRVPPISRSDFRRYLEHHHVSNETKLTPLSLLAVTEARLPSDGFSLIDPLDPSSEFVEVVFEIAGFKHFADEPKAFAPGDALDLQPEPLNPYDPNAIFVKRSGRIIGYVNRLQAPTIGHWLTRRTISCSVARVTGPAASPWAYAFMQVRPLRS
jgi:HIRAN domain